MLYAVPAFVVLIFNVYGCEPWADKDGFYMNLYVVEYNSGDGIGVYSEPSNTSNLLCSIKQGEEYMTSNRYVNGFLEIKISKKDIVGWASREKLEMNALGGRSIAHHSFREIFKNMFQLDDIYMFFISWIPMILLGVIMFFVIKSFLKDIF